ESSRDRHSATSPFAGAGWHRLETKAILRGVAGASHCTGEGNGRSCSLRGRFVLAQAAAYLDDLNPEQRRAVTHGAHLAAPGAPVLIIAGAGSGKTNTLAHRVAHLLVNGADPRRILLMTFSRRAAAEMTGRVQRIARKVLAGNAEAITAALTWAGTFHGLGGRLFPEYTDGKGLDPSFTSMSP